VDDANCSTPTPRCDLTTGNCVPNPDAGAPDAGPTDAGTDAGQPDAGPTDAGKPDAGGDSGIPGGGGGLDAGPGVIVAGPCQSDSDCPSGDRCSADTKTCVKDLFAVEGGGCSCRTEAPRGIDAGALLGFGFLGALTWRRRRNRQGADR
jgi:Cys-rich repeat protein